ncbi:MAG: HlyD family secretion protein [Flavobacteriales bacterium]
MENKSKIDEIRSSEVQDILGEVPNWTIRIGMTVILLILLLIMGLSWFIRYPDYISGPVSIKSSQPPVKIQAKSEGLLDSIYLQNGDTIHEGDLIASINNPLSIQAVAWLTQEIIYIDSVLKIQLTQNNISFTFKNSPFPLGSIQIDYNLLKNRLYDYELNASNSVYLNKKENLENQLTNYGKLVDISLRQLEYAKTKFRNAELSFNSQKKLYSKNIISKLEFMSSENNFILEKYQLESYREKYIQNKITQDQYRKELNELLYNEKESKLVLINDIQESIRNIKNQLNNWEHIYQIKSPTSGVLYFPTPLFKNKSISINDWLVSVSSIHDHFIGEIQVPTIGFGKIEKGQKVYIKLDNYPSEQYGQIVGSVSDIHVIPQYVNNGAYNVVEVEFENPRITSFNKSIQLNPINTGMAQIATNDQRIIERIFSFLRMKTSR